MNLFEQWLAVCREHPSEWAVFDFAAGKRWTFAELLAESERSPERSREILFPRGTSVDFLTAVLRGWRHGRPVCPLEPASDRPEIPVPPKNIVHLKLTSASTGSAKCVAFTGAQLAADARNIVATMGLRREWPNLACISLAHSYGFSNLVLPLLLHGIPLVLLPSPLPELLRRALETFGNGSLPAVPALWRAWSQSNSLSGRIQIAISAGAPLPLDLEERIFETARIKLHNFYGCSECGGIAYDRSILPRSGADYAGTALENVQLALGQNGTLIVESGAVAETYWPAPLPELAGGRFETPDLAELRDGAVWLRGRISDVINVDGRKVSPEAIEAELRRHPAVRECVVFGVATPDAVERSEMIVACINAHRPARIPDLAQFLSTRLPNWQIPRKWWFTQELAPTERGKISRRLWRERYLSRKRAVE